MRFNAIEEAFKRYFNFDDEAVLLERDQESYYEKNPQNLPGHTPGF
jgi:predicted transcriptional regulator